MLGFEKNSITTPCATAMTAAATCTSSFIHARRLTTSSMAPQATISTAPSSTPRTWRVMSANSTHAQQEAEEDCKPAHARDGVVVDAALAVGHVYSAHFCGEALDHGRGGKADGKGNGDGQQYPHPQLQIWQHTIYTLPGPPDSGRAAL